MYESTDVQEREYSQDVTNYTDAPHVGLRADGLVIYDFWGNEFRSSKKYSYWLTWAENLCETKVDKFYAV